MSIPPMDLHTEEPLHPNTSHAIDIYSELRDALGHSVLSEELRGDYQKSRSIAEALQSKALLALQKESTQETQLALADASLALGIVLTLQGFPGRAVKVLKESENQSSVDERRRIRAMLWLELARLDEICTYPGLVLAPPGSENLDVTLKWKEAVKDKYIVHNRNAESTLAKYRGICNDALEKEISLFVDFHLPTRISRSVSRQGAMWPDLCRETAVGLLKTPERLTSRTIPRFEVVLELNKADIYNRCGYGDKFFSSLATVRDISRATNRFAGLAVAKMMFGDSRVARSGALLLWNSGVDRKKAGGIHFSLEFVTGALDSRCQPNLQGPRYDPWGGAYTATEKFHANSQSVD